MVMAVSPLYTCMIKINVVQLTLKTKLLQGQYKCEMPELYVVTRTNVKHGLQLS